MCGDLDPVCRSLCVTCSRVKGKERKKREGEGERKRECFNQEKQNNFIINCYLFA